MSNSNPNTHSTEVALKILGVLISLLTLGISISDEENEFISGAFYVLLVLGSLILVWWASRLILPIGKKKSDKAIEAYLSGSTDGSMATDPDASEGQPSVSKTTAVTFEEGDFSEIGDFQPLVLEDEEEETAVSFAESDFAKSDLQVEERFQPVDLVDEAESGTDTDFTFFEDDFLEDEEEHLVFTDLDIPSEPGETDAGKKASSPDGDEDDDSGLIEFDVSDFPD